jgi:putative tail protein
MNDLVPHTLQGEVITKRDGVRVIGSPHPLKMARVEYLLPAGDNIHEMMEEVRRRSTTRLPFNLLVRIEGDPIPEEWWKRVRPKPGTTITFQAVLEGGGGGTALRSGLMIALAIAATVAATFLAGPAGFGFAAGIQTTIATALIGSGIMIAGQLLINALFPAQKPQLQDNQETHPSYSLGGARNTARPWGSIPLILGRHRLAPLYGATPYTEIVGNDQFLRAIFVVGYGPVSISNLMIGDTPISDYEDVQTEIRLGFASDSNVTLYPALFFEEQMTIELPEGFDPEATVRASPETHDVRYLAVDFQLPNGLYAVSTKTGVQYQYPVGFDIAVRRFGTSAWSTIHSETYWGNTKSLIRFGRSFNMTSPGRWEVRIRRTSFKNRAPFAQASEDLYLTAIRWMASGHPIQTPEPVALIAVRIRASAQLNGTLDTLSCIAHSQARVWTGSSWTTSLNVTNNPGDLIRLVLQGPSNKRPVPDSRIDLNKLGAFASYCVNQGYTFNQVIENATSVYDLCQNIAAAGRGIIVFIDGKWSVKWDDEGSEPIVQAFTPRNSKNFSAQRAYRQFPHAFRVQFVNEKKNWEQDERIVYDDGYGVGNATLFESIEFPGVTDPADIFRHARFHMAQARLRPETYKIQVDWENLRVTRGDRVRLSHDVPLIGQVAGRVKGISGTLISLDETVFMEAGKSYGIHFRLADGSFQFSSVAAVPGEATFVTLNNIANPAIGDLFFFGEYLNESAIMRVLSIDPSEDFNATLTLVDDAPEISQADKGIIPPFDSNISDPVNLLEAAPLGLSLVEFLYRQGQEVLAGAEVTWQINRIGATRSFELQMKNDGLTGDVYRTVAVVAAPGTTATINALATGVYSFRVRALFEDGGYSAFTYKTGITFEGLLKPPPDVQNFRINIVGPWSTLKWDAITVLNLSHYEIRYSPLTVGVQWGSATRLTTSETTNAMVPTADGTYLISAVTLQGVRSVTPTIIISEIGAIAQLNVVADFTEDPAWTGNTQGTVVNLGELLLGAADVMNNWTTLASVPNLYTGVGSVLASGVYNFANGIDLSEVYTSRVTPTIVANGLTIGNVMADWVRLSDIEFLNPTLPSEWEVTPEIRLSDLAPAAGQWTPWKALEIGDYKARSMQFRLLLEGNESRTVTPVVKAASINVDMPDRVEGEDDITTLASGVRHITFSPPFKEIPAVGVTSQGAPLNSRSVISNKTTAGFDVRFFDSLGAGIAVVIDWIAKGYGRVQPSSTTLPLGGGIVTATDFSDFLTAFAAKGRAGTVAVTDAADIVDSIGFITKIVVVNVTEASDTISSTGTVTQPVVQNDITLYPGATPDTDITMR